VAAAFEQLLSPLPQLPGLVHIQATLQAFYTLLVNVLLSILLLCITTFPFFLVIAKPLK
jgi:hypothetical protein